MSVGWTLHDQFCADVAAGADPVVHGEWLPHRLVKTLREQPRQHVRPATGCEREHDAHRPCRVLLANCMGRRGA
jgi:hypothetical protein